MMWSEKYRPASISGMIGNEEARASLVDWFSKWKRGAKPILLVGPPGTGKTTAATLAAGQFGLDMIGLNASDARSKSKINEILAPVLDNSGVMGSTMIFIDEVDGIHGRADFGGADALVKILQNPAVPIVLAANSDDQNKMKNIKKAVTTVSFRRLPPRLLRVYLQDVLKREGVRLGPGVIVRIVSESRGDIRSMLNLAQAVETGFAPHTGRPAESLGVEDGINAFFKAESPYAARRIMRSIRANPQDKIQAFYSSVVAATLKPDIRSRMLGALSEADILYGRIMRTQQWRLLRYLDETLMRLYISGTGVRYVKYNLPWPVLNRIMWDGRTLRAGASELAHTLHASRSAISTFYLPYMALMTGKGVDLGLDEKLISVLKKEAAR